MQSPAICIPLAIQAMNIHHTIEAVQAWSCALIESMFKGLPTDPTPLRAQAIHTVLACTNTYLQSYTVQEKGLDAIATICALYEGIQSVIKSDGVRLVVVSMMYHRNNRILQKFFCKALLNITKCEKCRPFVADAGSVGVLLNTMKMHTGTGESYDSLHQNASYALTQIVYSNNNIEKFVKAQGAERALKDALHSKSTDAKCKAKITKLLFKLHDV